VEVLASLLVRAKGGEQQARDELIALSTGFVLRTASAVSRRWLDWHNDDELSIALLALNEAIDSYDSRLGRGFYGHARRVITSRLIDHFRREGRHQHLSLDAFGGAAPALEHSSSLAAHQRSLEMRARLDEIAEYNRLLQGYGLSLADIKEAAPKHADTRERLREVARTLVANPPLVAQLERTHQLPLVELQRLAGVSRKVLETGRRYIIALAVLAVHEELTYLRSFAGLTAEGGDD